ncbi:type II secretion system protein [Candidatus Saccharibacteria bacterium]|nr:type II secretion system protein [Candidatus Saccharibacteria bacterium]
MEEIKSKKGFTVIEVALVLAIAGVIFLMVFIALPALQRSQRDAKRRDDVGVLLAALQRFQTNNRGALPTGDTGTAGVKWNSEVEGMPDGDTSWKGFYKSFLGKTFEDPAGFFYTLKAGDCGANTGSECSFGRVANDGTSLEASNYTMFIVKSAACDGSKAVGSGNPRRVAVLYKMEGSGGAYCANSQ